MYRFTLGRDFVSVKICIAVLLVPTERKHLLVFKYFRSLIVMYARSGERVGT